MKSDYDVAVSGPRVISSAKLARLFPNLPSVHPLKASLIHEVQTDDSRFLLNTLLTASVESFIPGMKGAVLANYVEFKDFVKDEEGKVVGAVLHDKVKNKEFKVKCKALVNCTGAHSDELRLKDDPSATKRIKPSRGTHIVLPKGHFPKHKGIIIPQTVDGRLIFIMNFHDYSMAGTTDV